jgi:hypothetical protein
MWARDNHIDTCNVDRVGRLTIVPGSHMAGHKAPSGTVSLVRAAAPPPFKNPPLYQPPMLKTRDFLKGQSNEKVLGLREEKRTDTSLKYL